MKTTLFYLSLFLLSCFFISCSKDNEPSSETSVYANFKPGSYWIYQRFSVDSSGNETATELFDSCYVVKDTLIHGETFYKYFNPDPFNGASLSTYSFLRDSAGTIVSENGYILFSSTDFETTFDDHYNTIAGYSEDTLYRVIVKMEDKDLSVTVPAGDFVTSDYRITYQMYPRWAVAGEFRVLHRRYAANVGLVVETLPFFASQPGYTVRKLVRYKLIAD